MADEKVYDLTPADLGFVLSLSQQVFLEIPNNAQMKGFDRPLQVGEKRFLAILTGVSTFLKSKGLLAEGAKIRISLEEADSLPTDEPYFESSPDPQLQKTP